MSLCGYVDISGPATKPIRGQDQESYKDTKNSRLTIQVRARVTALDPYLVTYLGLGTNTQPPIYGWEDPLGRTSHETPKPLSIAQDQLLVATQVAEIHCNITRNNTRQVGVRVLPLRGPRTWVNLVPCQPSELPACNHPPIL